MSHYIRSCDVYQMMLTSAYFNRIYGNDHRLWTYFCKRDFGETVDISMAKDVYQKILYPYRDLIFRTFKHISRSDSKTFKLLTSLSENHELIGSLVHLKFTKESSNRPLSCVKEVENVFMICTENGKAVTRCLNRNHSYGYASCHIRLSHHEDDSGKSILQLRVSCQNCTNLTISTTLI